MHLAALARTAHSQLVDNHSLSYRGSNSMKAYVMTTGAVFGLLTLAHIWRVIEEGPHLAAEPSYVFITVAAAALCLWASHLLWRSPPS